MYFKMNNRNISQEFKTLYIIQQDQVGGGTEMGKTFSKHFHGSDEITLRTPQTYTCD